MKKLILVSVLLFNVNAIAKEYNVVCSGRGYSDTVIRDIADIELAKEIVRELSENILGKCKILLVKN